MVAVYVRKISPKTPMKIYEVFDPLLSYDYTPIQLSLIAVGTILYSCGNSIRVLFRSLPHERRPSFLQATEETQEEITMPVVICMLVVSSTFLVLLYFLLDSLIGFLKCILSLSCIISVAFVSWDFFALLLPSNFVIIVTFAQSVFFCLLWYFTEHWIVCNYLTFCLCVNAISFIKVKRFQIVVLIAVGFLIYDVWWVFLSPIVFGKSVMVEAATGMASHIPALFSLPKVLSEKDSLKYFGIYQSNYSLGTVKDSSIVKMRLVDIPIYKETIFQSITDATYLFRRQSESLIGAGDIVIPGIVLDFFLQFDLINRKLKRSSNLFFVAFCGYVLGVGLSWIAANIMEKGQPALLWIFPSILIPTSIIAWKNGLLRVLWQNGTVSNSNSGMNSNESSLNSDNNDPNNQLNPDHKNDNVSAHEIREDLNRGLENDPRDVVIEAIEEEEYGSD